MTRRKINKIIVLIAFLALISAGVAMILHTISSNIMFFFTPTELSANTPTVSDKIIRVGGIIKPASVRKIENTITTEFVLTDCTNDIKVLHDGLLPMLFKEGQGIVSKGVMNVKDGVFYSKELLVKHDENYMPAELRKTLSADPICNPKIN